ncbi:threonine synthase [Helicobacter sp. MIT 05-5294]|uniref:threonine synthase n=1 Tax=Helicobacter sp. MIT 05-5294 TaxID=1548150 RepID=UPI0010FD417D|nr:threonine synthase [Helicobacter sp. MIT 05-5294]TLD87033.1 threonine synthase [Helicobacter sp. MIT 05-5294]
MQTQHFIGTRGGQDTALNFHDVVLNPNAAFGGLYTAKKLPKFDEDAIKELSQLNYEELAHEIFHRLNLNVSKDLLKDALKLYQNFDSPANPAPLCSVHPYLNLQKLYCGPTRAFKDMALQPFGTLFSGFLNESKREVDYLILVATSGDTGPATLQSFANKPHTKVVCIYPKGGTSDVQRLQMTTVNAENVKVFGIDGDFDDAQTLLKDLLKDPKFNAVLRTKNIALSAANSVNFGRIAFQIVYHAYSSLQIFKINRRKIHIIVPSGNFGNALGAFYAKLIGFPIERIWIATNTNNVLSEFINTGIYDISEKSLHKTYSPAMDILKSSNIERVLFTLFDAQRTRELMESLEQTKKYSLTKEELAWIKMYFSATSCDDNYCLNIIKTYAKKGYLIDPHTACGFKAYEEIKTKFPNTPCVLCSTAEWTKFAPTIAKALDLGDLSDKEALEQISKTHKVAIPKQIAELFHNPEIHNEVFDKEELGQKILEWL